MKGTTWVAVDDHLHADPRWIGLSGDAAKLYISAYPLAGDHLTDGIVTEDALAVLARVYRMKNPEALGAEILASGLLTPAPGGRDRYSIADYFRFFNRTAAQVEAARKKNRERVTNWRERQRGNAITPEDGQSEERLRNAITAGPVMDPQHSTAQDSYSRRGSTSAKRTRKRTEGNGFATENEVRDAEAAALAEDLAE